MRTIALLFLIAWTSCCSAQTPQNRPEYFSDIIKPSGWRIPTHGPVLGLESKSFGKSRSIVKAIRYKPLDHFAMPSFYKDEQGELVLSSHYFRARTFYAFEHNGVRFGYGAFVEGEGLGTAVPVYWLDMDGDGIFRRIAWGSEDRLEIPDWVERTRK